MIRLLTSAGDIVRARSVEGAARRAYGPDAHPTSSTLGWAVHSYVTGQFLGDLWPLEEEPAPVALDYPGPADQCAGCGTADMTTEACPNARDLCVDCCREDHGQHVVDVAWEGSAGYVARCSCSWVGRTGYTTREDARRLADLHVANA